MDTILKHGSEKSFYLTCLRDNTEESGIVWSVAPGRIFVNGSIIRVDGITFSGDADIYLTYTQDEEGQTKFLLTTNPPEGVYSRHIIAVKNGEVVKFDVSSLSLGCPEFTDHDTKTLAVGGGEPEYVSKRRRKIAEHNTVLCPFFESSYEDFTDDMEAYEGKLVQYLVRTKDLQESMGVDTSYIESVIEQLTTYADGGSEPVEE